LQHNGFKHGRSSKIRVAVDEFSMLLNFKVGHGSKKPVELFEGL
jgi:hypothetical protein